MFLPLPPAYRLPNHLSIKAVVCGWDFSIILSNENSLWVAGSNRKGAILLESQEPSFSFLHIEPRIGPIHKLSAGLYHVLALTNEKKLYGWGSRKNRSFGRVTNVIGPIPLELPEPFILYVAVGIKITVALGASGAIYTTSKDQNGFSFLFKLSDNLSLNLSQQFFLHSTWHSFFIMTPQELFGWGRNNFAQISSSCSSICISDPVLIDGLPFHVSEIAKVCIVSSQDGIL